VKIKTAMALLLGVAAAGCAYDVQDKVGGTADAVNGRHDQGTVPTLEANLQLLSPYNYVFDLAGTGAPCVAFADPNAASRVQVTDLATNVAINYVSSLSQLEEKLGFDATLGAKVDPVASGQITASYSHSFTKANSQYSYLLSVQQTYDVVASAPVKMVNQPAGVDDFLRTCGDSFVDGIRYGATLNILMTVDAPSQSQADQVAAGLTASATAPVDGVPVTGNVAGNVTSGSTSTSSQFAIQFALEAKGFDPRNGASGPITLPTSTDGTVIPDTVAALQAYVDTLASSVRADRAADVAATGANASRSAVATQVVRSFYTLTAGFDASNNPFGVLSDREHSAAIFLNDFGYLKAQLDDVYYDEIQGFLQADDGTKSKFNVAPPGQPFANAQSVGSVVQQQEAVFRPDDGSGQLQGNVTSGVRRRLFQCFEAARAIDSNGATTYAGCTGDATKEPEYVAALAALDQYAASSRVLATHFYSAGDHVYYRAYCDSASSAVGATLTLADNDQIAQLAPAVAADADGCAYYNDTTGNACGWFSEPYFSSNSSGDTAYKCQSKFSIFYGCATLCVPPDGVFGTPALLGSGSMAGQAKQ
jgi:hypothetical protein